MNFLRHSNLQNHFIPLGSWKNLQTYVSPMVCGKNETDIVNLCADSNFEYVFAVFFYPCLCFFLGTFFFFFL